MAVGLAALLDDIAALAKLAAASIDDIGLAAGKASTKAAGVVIDDTAVTPRYVHGFTADRELPIIKKIAMGSLRNKLLVIVPVALLLSAFAPWALTPLLMLGGSYLVFEGAEKLWEYVAGGGHHDADHDGDIDAVDDEIPAAMESDAREQQMVAGAIRTDFILSAEIIVISLNALTDQPFVTRAISLIVVAIVMTALVYGVVALIVKMDDLGLALAERQSSGAQRFGRALVAGMPRLLAALSVIGVGAMLWVGGHILLVGADHLGWHAPYAAVHHLEQLVGDGLGGALAWSVNTLASALAGLFVGAVIVGLVHLIGKARGTH